MTRPACSCFCHEPGALPHKCPCSMWEFTAFGGYYGPRPALRNFMEVTWEITGMVHAESEHEADKAIAEFLSDASPGDVDGIDLHLHLRPQGAPDGEGSGLLADVPPSLSGQGTAP